MQNTNGTPADYPSSCSTHANRISHSIDHFIFESIAQLKQTISRKMIRVDLDLSPVDELVQDGGQLPGVIFELIKLGVDSTPVRGDLSITLVAAPYQWELEVADSAPSPSIVWFHDSGRPRGAALVRAIPLLQGKLEPVIRGAQSLGGTIQSWGCPQGGTANVLTMPRRQRRMAA